TEGVRAAERLETMVAERTTDLRAARDRAELANAATTKFLATASHDIRQPLQAMALLLGSLKGEVRAARGRENWWRSSGRSHPGWNCWMRSWNSASSMPEHCGRG